MHVLEIVIAQHRQAALVESQAQVPFQRIVAHVAKVALPERLLAPARGQLRVLQHRQQRETVAFARYIEPEPVEHGRHDIDIFGEIADLHAAAGVGLGARIADDQRDMVGLIEITELGRQPVVAELLAMIGSKDNQRRIPLTAGFQTVEQSTEIFVDLVYQAEIVGHVLLDLALRIRGAETAVVDEVIQQRVLQRFLLRRFTAQRLWHLSRIVHAVIGLRRRERRVRP